VLAGLVAAALVALVATGGRWWRARPQAACALAAATLAGLGFRSPCEREPAGALRR
jgi:hypothetical protein